MNELRYANRLRDVANKLDSWAKLLDTQYPDAHNIADWMRQEANRIDIAVGDKKS